MPLVPVSDFIIVVCSSSSAGCVIASCIILIVLSACSNQTKGTYLGPFMWSKVPNSRFKIVEHLQLPLTLMGSTAVQNRKSGHYFVCVSSGNSLLKMLVF